MLWLNILCKCSSVICDVISVSKHGSFNKRRQNFTKNSIDLNPVDYSVWRHCNKQCIDGLSQNFRHLPAETCANRLLGSDKPGHVKSSDWLAATKTDNGYQGQGGPCWISSGLNMCVNDRYSFIVCPVKIH